MTNEFNLDGKFRSYSIGLMPYIQAAGLFDAYVNVKPCAYC